MKQDERAITTQKQGSSRFLFPYFVSLCSLLLCCAMLFGTTFAWFTSNVSSTGNRINSGGLCVDVIHGTVPLKNEMGKNETGHSVFSGASWRPDHMEMVTVELQNVGELPICYKLDFLPDETNPVSNEVTNLFQVYVKAGELTAQDLSAVKGTELNLAEWKNVGTLTQVMKNNAYLIQSEDVNTSAEPDKGVLVKGGTQPVSIALYMPHHTDQSIMNSDVHLFLSMDAWQKTQDPSPAP